MIARIYSAAVRGVDATLVDVEVAFRELPDDPMATSRTVVVGLPDAAVRESIERVNFSLQACEFMKPKGTHVINLAPADLKKEGPSFDLPIAIAMALSGIQAGLGAEEFPDFSQYLFAGELSLDGNLRPIKGVLALAVAAKESGKTAIILPAENAEEAALISGLEVYGAETLQQVWDHITDKALMPKVTTTLRQSAPSYSVDFSDVKGQAHTKRAIEIAAAGGHNILLSGSPGTGKSMLAQRISTILPPLLEQEIIDTTKVYSVAGVTPEGASYVKHRPFRSPHHTISDAGLLGGGSNISPGEVSLAHNGVLFLDEFPEFRKSSLESMRQLLEDRKITISRASGTLTFPSQFMLVAAMNPCPCGYKGDPKVACSCFDRQLESYENRLSGPILDRIDIQIDVPRVDYAEFRKETNEESSATIRERVIKARRIQYKRYKSIGDQGRSNAEASPKAMEKFCQLDEASHQVLERMMIKFGYSGRAHNRILKVARTIADLAGEEQISQQHLMESVQYRSRDRNSASKEPNKVTQLSQYQQQKRVM